MAISDDDLDACFLTDDFAVPAVFAATGGNVTVNGYFSDAAEVVDHNDGKVVAAAPTFTCRTSKITGVRRGNTVTIDGKAYKVERYLKSGMGVSDVYLKT